jgi:hypothetical protein
MLKHALFKQNRLFVGLILGGHQWDDKTRMTVDTSDREACIGGVAYEEAKESVTPSRAVQRFGGPAFCGATVQ